MLRKAGFTLVIILAFGLGMLAHNIIRNRREGYISPTATPLKGSLMEWQKLPAPPERVSKILTINPHSLDFDVIVKTASGKIYNVSPWMCSYAVSSSGSCWEEFSGDLTQVTLLSLTLKCSPNIDYSEPPENIVQRFDLCDSYGTSAQLSAALVSDGSVWTWENHPRAPEGPTPAPSPTGSP